MQYLQKINSWRDKNEKLILRDSDQTFYVSAKAAMAKAQSVDKDIWQCSENGHLFYVLREKDVA
ncbi:hypothetical protein [Litoribrevibacter albus]|uniref:Uncharacterized protein n=1 Tax=Litoribrevibacter albus TaxID=1473156 RepID=A0AA37SA74_9GAMM|nr:hypothetical protein [Litoribrevibacter albus]GLQ32197.1 hypothetical protein GCM10007876_26760 [Litoribrevibacter albus]